jgi:hypothetical protein
MFQSLAIGIAVLGLLAPKLASVGGLVRFLLSLCIMACTAFFGALSLGSTDSTETILALLLSTFMGTVLLAAAVAAGRLCHWRYLPGRFTLWLGACLVIGTVAALFVFFLLVIAITSSGSPALSSVLPQMTAVGLIFGVCLYVFVLPFMILGFANSFFRDRLRACLNLRPPGDATGNGPGPDRSGPEPEHSEPAPPLSS